MEKNTTVINPKGKSIKVADHMVGDMLKHGCTLKVPQRKDPPIELTKSIKLPPPRVITPAGSNLPDMNNTVGEQGRGSANVDELSAYKKKISVMNKTELSKEAEKFPKAEWEKFNKKDLVVYLTDKEVERLKVK